MSKGVRRESEEFLSTREGILLTLSSQLEVMGHLNPLELERFMLVNEVFDLCKAKGYSPRFVSLNLRLYRFPKLEEALGVLWDFLATRNHPSKYHPTLEGAMAVRQGILAMTDAGLTSFGYPNLLVGEGLDATNEVLNLCYSQGKLPSMVTGALFEAFHRTPPKKGKEQEHLAQALAEIKRYLLPQRQQAIGVVVAPERGNVPAGSCCVQIRPGLVVTMSVLNLEEMK